MEARKPAKVQITGQVWMTVSEAISSLGNTALARKQKIKGLEIIRKSRLSGIEAKF